MNMARRPTGAARGAVDDAAPAAGSVATPDTGIGASQSDYAQFIWGKLNDIDGSLKDLAEKHGRLDEKLTNVSASISTTASPIQKAVEKLEGKVSKLETTIRWATAIVVVLAGIASAGMTLYKIVDSHLSITWH